MRTRLTAKERFVLTACQREYILTGAYVLHTSIERRTKLTKRSVAGVISSLCRKGLLSKLPGENVFDDIELTEAGQAEGLA